MKNILYLLFIALTVALSVHQACAEKRLWNWEVANNFCRLMNGDEDLVLMRQALQAYKRDPNYEGAFFLGWRYYFLNKDWPNAEAMARRAAQRHPEWPSPHFALGQLAVTQMDYVEARDEFRKAIEIKPCWPDLYLELDVVLVKLGCFKEAVTIADQGLRLTATAPQAYIQDLRHEIACSKGKALLGAKDYKACIAVLEPEVRYPGYVSDLIEGDLADAYIGQKDWKRAIKVLTHVLKIQPRNDLAYLVRARAYEGNGDSELALRDADVFLSKQKEPGRRLRVREQVEAHSLKAKIYDKLGKKDLAAKERALMNRQNEDIYEQAWFREEEDKAKKR